MPRPRFEPDDDQEALLRALAHLAEQRRIAMKQVEQIDNQTDEVIGKAAAADIPIDRIATTAGRTRKTVYRHLGKPMK